MPKNNIKRYEKRKLYHRTSAKFIISRFGIEMLKTKKEKSTIIDHV